MKRQRHGSRCAERGVVMVIVAFAAGALILFAALAIDVGFIWASRTQSQNVSDAASLAAAARMISNNGTLITAGPARQAAKAYAKNNSTVANPQVIVQDSDFEFGTWNFDAETLDPPDNPTDPRQLTGVRVTVRQDGSDNKRSPVFLAGLGGFSGFDVVSSSVAYLGFEGTWDPRGFDLPIAIDSCLIGEGPDGCEGLNFCDGGPPPGGGCTLDAPQAGDGNQFTCLELSPTGTQNACYTGFSGTDQQSTSTNNLRDLVRTGNTQDIAAGFKVFLDNGNHTSVLRRIEDRMDGTGPFSGDGPAGVDRYAPLDGQPDSWVVKLPVVECQDTARCATGQTFAIVGGVCFEVREVLTTPRHEIRGRFLCPGDALFSECNNPPGSGPGACGDFGLRADRPVLVQ